MAYTVVEDYRFGLDARRSELTSKPGVLEVLTNGHINQGGEVEKRKAFTQIVLPEDTFGLQSDGEDLWVFGSAAAPVGLPSGVQYQRLQAPVGVVLGVTQYATMTGVVYSTIHDGQLFVIASFDDNRNHVFYNGMEVSDFYAGYVLQIDSLSLPVLAAKFVSFIDALDGGFNATQLAPVNDNQFDVVGTYGEDYSLTDLVDSTHGVVNVTKTADAIAPRDGTPAVASFRIMGGTASAGNNQILTVEIGPVGGALVSIMNAAVDFTQDNPGTAAAVAASINTKNSTPEYTATSSLDTVQIYAASTASPIPNGYEVRVTVKGNVCVDDCSFFLQLDADGTSFTLAGLYANGVQILSATFLVPPLNVFPGTHTVMTSFAQAVVDDINANSATHGYVAYRTGHYIRVSRKVTSNQLGEIIVNPYITGDGSTGGGITPGAGGPLQATVPNTNVTSLETSGSSGKGQSSVSLCQAAGGSGSYPSFLWQEETANAANGITILSPNSPSTAFYCPGVSLGGLLQGRFVCIVTDSNGTKVTSNTCVVSFTAERFESGNA